MTKRTLTILTAALCWTSAAHAQDAADPAPLVLEAINITAAESAEPRGGDEVLPGDVVEYRLHFTNLTGREVRNIVFDNPLPGGMSYVAGSAKAEMEETVIEFSADGGGTFSPRPMVEDVDENGERVQRPATAEEYTHVRWTLTGGVIAGARVTASFRARLIEPTQ